MFIRSRVDEILLPGTVVVAAEAVRSQISFVKLAKESVQAWMDDYAPSMGAALAYYTLFSLAPLLLLVIAIAGAVFGAEAARGEVIAQVQGLIGHEGAVSIEGLLKAGSQPTRSIVASAVGIITLIVGATSIFAELQSDLDRVWDAAASDRPAGLWGLLRTRLLSFGLIVSIGFLLLVSLVVSAALAAFGTWYGGWFPGWAITLQIINQIVSLAFITVLFALMYRILPSVRVEWHDVWLGAFATSALFTIGKFLIGLYIGKAGVTSGFGAAGSIVVLLVWVFYSAQVFLLGAEFTATYSRRHGSRKGESVLSPARKTASTDGTPTESSRANVDPDSPPHRSADLVVAGGYLMMLGIFRSWRRRHNRRRTDA
jgi:membrane protein